MKQKPSLRRSRGNSLRLPVLTTAVFSMAFFGAAAQAAEATYQHYRFTPTANHDNGTAIQLSEFTFSHQGQKLNLNGTTGIGEALAVTVSGAAANATEVPANVVDGNLGTKWYNGSRAPLVFSFEAPVTIDSYNFATANDALNRTPISWTLEGSNDGETYVTLDTRTSIAPAYLSLFAYQRGFPIAGLSGIPVINSVSAATPAVIASGGSTTLSWNISGATSLTLSPGDIPLDASGTGSHTVSPTETTTYTLTATNATGTNSRTIEVRVAPAIEAEYRFVRFTPLALRNEWSANSIQIGEFGFFLGDEEVVPVAVTNQGGRYSDTQSPSNLIDGDATTKWLDFNKQGVIFDFGEVVSLDGYQLTTANDATERDPVRWLLEGSTDGTSWTTLENVASEDYPLPVARLTPTGKLPFTYQPLSWDGSESAAWDTTTANFADGAVYQNGDDVIFTDGAASAAPALGEQLTPRSISVTNDTAAYTLQGEAAYGPGGLIKNGSSSFTFLSANSLQGALVLNQGSVVSSASGALGQGDAPGKLFLRDGAELAVTVSQRTQRPLTVSSGIVDVSADTTFTHVGPVMLDRTLTKTGPGTLRFEGALNSASSADHLLLVSEGVVEFGTGYFNRNLFGTHRLRATVEEGATLRGTTTGAFGGDYGEFAVTIGQLRAHGGTIEFNGGTQYLPVGFLAGDEQEQGRIVLEGGILTGNGTIESSNPSSADGTRATRTIITAAASSAPSYITGTAALTANPSHFLLDVADGEAAEDLIVSRAINGNYGIIKEGPGNLVLTSNNTYQGRSASGTADPEDPEGVVPTLPYDLPDGTTVRAGTLTVKNVRGEATPLGSATGESSVWIGSPAVLAGTGFITGEVAVAGTVAPGDAVAEDPIGTLTLGSTALTGSYQWQVDGVRSDLLVVEGDLDLTGATLDVSALGSGATEASYVIATYSGVLTGTFATVPAGYEVVYNETEQQIELTVGDSPEPEGYDAWAAEAGLTGENASPTADPDQDGLENIIEFVVGGNPSAADNDKAPTSALDEDGNLVFTFRRTAASAYLNPAVEYSTTLAADGWTAAESTTVTVEENGFEDGVDKVTVTLPSSLAEGGKLFARLTVAP